MDPSIAKALRGFVGLSLLLGGIALAAGAKIAQDFPTLPAWVAPFVLAWIVLLAVLTFLSVQQVWPWPIPAGIMAVSLMLGLFWAGADPFLGHEVLSGLAPFVAFVTGIGILLRERWSWPVAFASVTGFGPILLLFAPLPAAATYGAFILFVVDAVFLLALAESFFEKPVPKA